MPRLSKRPLIWFSVLVVWYGILWILSSIEGNSAPQRIPHLDKFQHFAYFLGGGFFVAGWLFRLRPASPDWKKIIATAIAILAVLGALDEWHQCYTPGRSGADLWDWLADLLGASAGAFILKTIARHHLSGTRDRT